MTIIGIDPSVRKSGVVVRGEDGNYRGFLVRPPTKAEDPGRLYWMATTIVAECRLPPEEQVLLVIEQPTPKRMLEVNFVLFWRIREEFAWYYDTETLPICAQLNKFATGDGSVSEIGGAVVRQWGDCLPGESDPDVLDALALCVFGEMHAGLRAFGNPDPRLAEMREKVVRWMPTRMKQQAVERETVNDRRTFDICRGER